MKVITFLSATSLSAAKTTENRLLPFIQQALKKNYVVNLITPDSKKIVIKNKNFFHEPLNITNKKDTNIFFRGLQELFISFLVVNAAIKMKSSYFFVTIPSPLIIFLCFLLPKHKLIIDIRDLTWNYLPSNTFLKSIFKNFVVKISEFFLERANLMLASNLQEKNYLLKVFGRKKKIKLISNGVSSSKFMELSKLNNLEDQPVVGYFGSMGKAQNIAVLIRLAQKHKNIKFVLSGAGSQYNHIESQIKKLELNNVNITPRLDWEQLKIKYEKTNIFFAQLTDDYKSAVPSKLYEYLATGKYIFFSGSGAAAQFLKNFENNITIEQNDFELMDMALLKILRDKKFMHVSQKNIDTIQKSYIRERVVISFFDYLESL